MKSKEVKVDEAKYVVDKDELDQVKGEFEEDDVVKVVDESIDEEESIDESFTIKKGMVSEMISNALSERVAAGNHSLKDNPSIPKLSGEDYLMKMIDAKYDDICKTIKTNTGNDFLDFTELIPKFSKDLKNIAIFEEEHKEALTQLAIRIILEEFGLDQGEINFDAEIIPDVTEIYEPINSDYSPINGDDIDLLQSEIHKRRIINALIQGGARDLTDTFKMKKNDIANIDTRLYHLYRNILPVGDLMYFSNDDETGAIKTGSLSIVKEGDTPTIVARGVNFPTLLMQLAKGTFELLLGSEPDERYNFIKSKADKEEFESDDIRLGLVIYNKIINKINSRDHRVKYLVLNLLSDVEVPEFHKLMKDILGNTVDGDKHIIRLVQGAINLLNEYDKQGEIHESGYVDENEIDTLDFGDLM